MRRFQFIHHILYCWEDDTVAIIICLLQLREHNRGYKQELHNEDIYNPDVVICMFIRKVLRT